MKVCLNILFSLSVVLNLASCKNSVNSSVKSTTTSELKKSTEKQIVLESSVTPKSFDLKKLKAGMVTMDVLKTSPNGVTPTKSALSIFSCMNSVNDNDRDTYNGFILLSNSRAVINRDLNYQFKDGSSTAQLNPHVIFDCDSKSSSNEQDNNNDNEQDFNIKELERGHAMMVPTIVSPKGYYPVQSELLFISCSENVFDAAFSGVNGVGLIIGSRLLVNRDMDYQFGDGSRASGDNSILIISCK